MKKLRLVLSCIAFTTVFTTMAHADTESITQEEIDRMFIDEVKLPGKTLQCFQNGQEIIHEVGLKAYEETLKRIKATRLDGSTYEVLRDDAEIVCTVITRHEEE